MSNTPEITAFGVASPTPAGPVIGQISTHLPHLRAGVEHLARARGQGGFEGGFRHRVRPVGHRPMYRATARQARRCGKKEGRHAGGLLLRTLSANRSDRRDSTRSESAGSRCRPSPRARSTGTGSGSRPPSPSRPPPCRRTCGASAAAWSGSMSNATCQSGLRRNSSGMLVTSDCTRILRGAGGHRERRVPRRMAGRRERGDAGRHFLAPVVFRHLAGDVAEDFPGVGEVALHHGVRLAFAACCRRSSRTPSPAPAP